MRSPLLFLGAALCATCVTAQDAQAPLTREPLEGRANQKIERIQHEDAGSRIDELRYGGRTERVIVQPSRGPEYEVRSEPGADTRPSDTRDGPSSPSGRQRWNLFRF
ncbi:hypothetical protein JI739_04490 [Ramlibacter sp. AW1]|uniref:DUF2782 domain-containing protein n=1 Tax=Ramlibacter aurantiacus TaxID=2801330 RepID=A0A937D571_9BURK|nr:hypothetical protein [Ramlibacter aurantiacus]MBL0419603.1 hypothetical protein [Ramlibacter aurantiacus]